MTGPLPSPDLSAERIGAGSETLSLVEETLRVATEQVVTGRLRVATATETVEHLASLSLATDRVEVTRHAIDRTVSVAPEIRTEGDVTIVPILEEIMVVEKRLVLKEELHIRRFVSHETVEVPVTLRQQRAVIERVGADPDRRGNEEITP